VEWQLPKQLSPVRIESPALSLTKTANKASRNLTMPKVTVAVPHTEDADEIVKRAEPYIEKMVDDFQGDDLELEWEGRKADFSFTSLTFKIKGNVEVDDKQIEVAVDLPFAAMMFKDKVEKAIKKNLTRAVEGEQEQA
jgi:hypothetical protein